MTRTDIALPEVVTREEWLEARKELLVREKELTRARDALSADRRRLPMVRIEKEYVFEGPDGEARLLDLFETYSTYGRGGETVGGAHYFDLTALGRQEEWEEPAGRAIDAPSGGGRILYPDEYDE